MKKRLLAIMFVLACISGTAAYSEEEAKDTGDKPKEIFKHSLGAEASTISGAGISYGYRFLPDYMVKASGMFYEDRSKVSNPDDSSDKDYTVDMWWNAGMEFQRNIFRIVMEDAIIEGYGLVGGSYWFEEYKDPFYPADDRSSKSWTAGAAVGGRLILFERVSLNLAVGFQYSRDINDEERNAGFAGSAGIHLMF